jgi:phosphonate transport system substrate-binding protein
MRNTIVSALRRLLIALLVLGAAGPAHAAKGTAFTLAVIPSSPPVSMHTQWMPFAELLARETGFDFRLKLYENMAEFERDIWGGGPDFIFSSPIQLMVAHKSNGYVPLLRGEKMVAIGLFVRKDSTIKSVGDLAGKKIAFVGNKNICSVYIRHLLANNNQPLSYITEYSGSTRNVVINVLLGKSDAGAIFIPELAREPEQTRMQLRELMVTPQTAPHPLSAHPRVPRAAREAVKQATFDLAASPAGAELLRTLRLADPIPADYERDYGRLEEINVEGLANWGK